jgi:Glutathione-dependent formaldehyde-activating enzyme
MKIEGGCLCGKVRYSADVEPTFVGVCHCKNCQKGTGTAFSVVVALPTPALSVQGTLRTYTRPRRQRQSYLPTLLSGMRVGADRRGRGHAECHDDHGRHAR